MNLNIQTKCSDFRFNLTKVKIHNTYHAIATPVGLFFSNIFRFNEIGCNKYDSLKRLKNGNFQIIVTLLYAHYPICFFLSCKQYSHALHSA